MSAALRAELVDLQRDRVQRLIAGNIGCAGCVDLVHRGQAYVNGYLVALVGNGLIDHAEFDALLKQVTAAANDRLAALRGLPFHAPTGSPPSQRTPAAAEPVGAPLSGGAL